MPSCEHAARFCQERSKAGDRARIFCGGTCGCDIHNSPLFYTGPGYGCAPLCLVKAKQRLAQAACVDELTNSTRLQNFVEAFKQQRIDPQFDRFSAAVQKHGCQAVHMEEFKVGAAFFCLKFVGVSATKSGTTFCPIVSVIHMSIHMIVHMSVHMPILMPVYISVLMPICRSYACLYACLYTRTPVHISAYRHVTARGTRRAAHPVALLLVKLQQIQLA